MNNKLLEVKNEMNKVMVGKEEEINLLLISFIQGGHVLLESVPGTGKTLLAKTFAKTVDCQFRRIQFTPDVLPNDITGIQYFNPKTQEFEKRPGPIMTNVLLADEINRATPRTQSSLLEVMEEHQVTIEGETVAIELPFIVIATQNPVESQQGTFPLPAAQLDRFFMKIPFSYPTIEEEREVVRRFQDAKPLDTVNVVLTREDLAVFTKETRKVRANEDVETYLLELVKETRQHPFIELGVSPRATLALFRAAQGRAYLEGRAFMVPEDVRNMAPFVLNHRVSLSAEASLTHSIETVMQEIILSTALPVESGV